MIRTCLICGATLPPRRTKYCSATCSRRAERQKVNAVTAQYRTEPNVRHTIKCPDCGRIVDVHIKSKRCAACQREADKRHDMESKRRISAGNARTIGEQYLCENCGKPYILASGMQKWCMMCRDAMYTEMQRRTSREWNAKAYEDPLKREEKNAHVRVSKPQQINCGICGKLFERTDGVTIYCSDECRKKAIKRRQHISDAKRAEKRKADRRKRNEKDHQ